MIQGWEQQATEGQPIDAMLGYQTDLHPCFRELLCKVGAFSLKATDGLVPFIDSNFPFFVMRRRHVSI